MPVKKNVTHAEILLYMEKRVLNRALVHSNKLAAYDAETAAQHHAMAKKLIDNERKQAQMTKAILRSQDAKLTAAHNAEINQPKVWMSHKLVESAHRLDVNEKRLMALAASKIDLEFDSRNVITITKDEFAEVFFKDNSDYAYKALRDAAISISNKDINWRDSSLNRSGNLKWVYSCEYYSDAMKNGCHTDKNAHVKIGISPPIVEHLQSVDGGKFLFYKLIEFAKLKTVYGQRLFELLMKFADTGFLTINIKDFLLAMEVPEGYLKDDGMPKDFGNINKRVSSRIFLPRLSVCSSTEASAMASTSSRLTP